jgi:Flp pilus assembly pilin Flp
VQSGRDIAAALNALFQLVVQTAAHLTLRNFALLQRHQQSDVRRRRRRGFLADENGATAIEFGLVAAPFVALLVAITQSFLVLFASQLLETVVTPFSLLILTGRFQRRWQGRRIFRLF